MSAAEFSGYLAKGLGRAHLVLEQSADASLGDALLAACLTNPAFDKQVEGSRAAYLIELVRLADETDRLATSLTDLLNGSPDDHDIEQRFELAGLLARDGVPGMREALYRGQEQVIDRWFTERPPVLPSSEPGRQIIALDGVGGALFVFGQLGRVALADPEFWDGDELVREARNALDGDEADAKLAGARAADLRVDAYLLAVERQVVSMRDGGQPPRGWWDAPWSEARKAIEEQVRGTGQLGYIAWKWGKKASDKQLALAAKALVDLPKGDLELLRPYLCVFKQRPFPLDPGSLISLIDDPREKVAWFALNALEKVQHPAVREAALRIAEHGPFRQRALDLLARNWEPGDERIAERLLRREDDPEAVHSVCHGLRDVIEAHASGELVPALLLGYEWTPCSLCREHFVTVLLRLDALPDALRAECRWDASEETRRLVSPGT